MVKFPEAQQRIFGMIYVCRNCKTKVRSNPQKINLKKQVCKKCGKKVFRPKKKGQQKAGAGAA